MKAYQDALGGIFTGVVLTVLSPSVMAIDKILEVEIHNSTSWVITPGKNFSWLEKASNSGHDFVIDPGASQELTYYFPQSRAADSFTYRQGRRGCRFSFGHLTASHPKFSRWVGAKSTGSIPAHCSAELLPVKDDDRYVRNGGTRILFTME